MGGLGKGRAGQRALLCSHSHLPALPNPCLLLEALLTALSLLVPDDFTDVFSPQ